MNRYLPVLATATVLAALLIGIAAYEYVKFGWHFAREEAPGASSWHYLRATLIALASFALVWSINRSGQVAAHSMPLGQRTTRLAYLAASLAVGAGLLLLYDPHLYQAVGAEDSAIEWLTALSLFLASIFSALQLRSLLRDTAANTWRWLHLLGAFGFTVLFFIMGMEEVSWFQRQIGFATPEAVAAHNWQGEFNLHNFQTDITELALYSATGLFLMLLPLVRERLADWTPVRPFIPLLPDRAVAAISAPMLIFTYSHWNLAPVQAAFWIGLAACIAFARSATRGGQSGEARLWYLLAALVAVGQLVHLSFGHTMVAIYDSSEYRELFFGIGLAAYGFRQWRASA